MNLFPKKSVVYFPFFPVLLGLFILATPSFAQMLVGTDTLYGNEWINYSQKYYKIRVVEDGRYRVSYQELVDAGMPAPEGTNLQLFYLGQEVPIKTSTNGIFSTDDYFEFYGKKNSGTIDAFLYPNQDDQLNPDVSLFNDTSAYFLTITADGAPARYDNIPNDLTDLPAKETFCRHRSSLIFENSYHHYSDGIEPTALPQYNVGEGYSRGLSNNSTFNISTKDVVHDGNNAEVAVRFYTTVGQHDFGMDINNINFFTDQFSGRATRQWNVAIPADSLNASGNNQIHLYTNLAGTDANTKMGIASIHIDYRRGFDFSGEDFIRFRLDGNNARQYIEIENFNHGDTPPLLFDMTNQLSLTATVEGNLTKFVLPPASGEREIVVVAQPAIKNVIDIHTVDFVNYDTVQGDYLIITNPMLEDDGNGNNYVQQYADYRASATGGGFSPVILDIEQLFNQFAYGIDYHEISMKNFTNYAIRNWDARYVLLIGKGVTVDKIKHGNYNWTYVIPGSSLPESDHMIATGLNSLVPQIPVGRLAVQTPGELKSILDKTIAFEDRSGLTQTIDGKLWTKKIIHLAGGDDAVHLQIKNHLSTLENIIEHGAYGGKVTTFAKSSTDPVQNLPSEQLSSLLQDGVSLITFYGHSATATFDFNLAEPDEFNNEGKYPILLALGCSTNRVNEVVQTLSEKYTNEFNEGTVAFIGATWSSATTSLNKYSKLFYQNLTNSLYGQRLGDVVNKTIEEFGTSQYLGNCMLLLGDPALQLYNYETPDYTVNTATLKVTPEVINNKISQLRLDFSIANLGKGTADSLHVSIDQKSPAGVSTRIFETDVPAPYFEEDYGFDLLLSENNQLGENQLEISLDPTNQIEEKPLPEGEMNNTATIPFYVISNEAFPVTPLDYSIVTEQNQQLIASTPNIFSDTIDYYFEMDTTALFDSPAKQSSIIPAAGNEIIWQPLAPYLDSTVYYWRVSVDSALTDGQGFLWKNSSFLFLENGHHGWNQSHFYQINDDYLVNIRLQEPTRKLSFVDDYQELYVLDGAGRSDKTIATFLNNVRVYKYNYAVWGGVELVVFDQNTMQPWKNYRHGDKVNNSYGYYYPGEYDSQLDHYTSNYRHYFGFSTIDTTRRAALINFLENVVPDGDYVLFQTIQQGPLSWHPNWHYEPEEWEADTAQLGTNLFEILEANGAQQIRSTIGNPRPYMLFYQKGHPEFAPTEVVVADSSQQLEAEIQIQGSWNAGDITSKKIGPALSWDRFVWQASAFDAGTDSLSFEIHGIDTLQKDSLLMSGIVAGETDISFIDATEFPYLKLVFHASDETNETCPNLDYWRVYYDPVPEALLSPQAHFVLHKDTVQQGEPFFMEMAIKNISDVNMDSLLVKYTVTGEDNNATTFLKRIAPVAGENTVIDHFPLETFDRTGKQRIKMEINPDNDQPELYHFNNLGLVSFFVEKDVRNPLLDVTFDGIHILDGDIVSSSPEIVISLKDENKFLALNDTTHFSISLIDPGGQVHKYSVNDPEITFFPAEETNLDNDNTAKIEFRPQSLSDGIYQLKVQGKDRTGNRSGAYDYLISFEIINEEMISNVLNYPNPFSTSTRFVFTLTGDEMPEYMSIQIMTVSGKVIREIGMEELGPLRIGKNITEFAWDGTDEFGDKLANGIYLYRVVIKKTSGEDYEKYDTQTDNYFKNGIGKMVLIR